MTHTSMPSDTNPYGHGFTNLSPTVIYRTPPKTATPSHQAISKDPHLIVLATWLNAEPKHVAQYALGYQRLFPTSRILLVTTATTHFLFQPTGQRIQELGPALEILQDVQNTEKVLLHIFSSGGTCAMYQLASEYRTQTGKCLPVSKIVFDSCPGTVGYASTVAAFSVNLPKNLIAWGIGNAFYRVVFGRENVVQLAYEGFWNEQLFPRNAARLYVYSLKDELIRAQDVEVHAEATTRMGQVRKLRYRDSVHVGHMFQDPSKYWGNVASLWDSDYLSGPGLITLAW
ncbi:hypothetical protein BDV95DRAFT_591227 [Massariosphaeria phaeospora]|uniref:Indole-diterpene biosynthesis protein-like protein PaxU n=1 Tax=Massariosphaeria phaeospora TaxID=100035 RepID=A0A7C8IGH8_9PLEO|nr:hypothetical protein BDV95DRAFT_591227 [Massariosphaeria phaeospora]